MSRRTLILALLAGFLLTVAISWALSTRALDTPRLSLVAVNGSPSNWKDIARYERFGSTDVRCMAGQFLISDNMLTPSTPEDLTSPWMRPYLVPWGWDQPTAPGAFSVRTIKISGWPLPCLWSLYEAVPSAATWPHKAISGIVIDQNWTGFGVKYIGEMPVAFPYRPLWFPLLLNTLFFAAILTVPFSLIGHLRRARRRRRGHCPTCNYDLHGLTPGSPCPECGKLA